MRIVQRLGASLFALALAAGCSTDKPSTPVSPPTSPVPPTTLVGVSLTIAVSDSELFTSQTPAEFANVVISGNRTDSGAAMPSGTQVVLTTNLGALGSAAGGQSLTLDLVSGRVETAIFAGTVAGVANLRVDFTPPSGSPFNSASAFATVRMVQEGPAPPFYIQALSPSFGSPQGGERVDILGAGFDPPLRVLLGTAAAQVVSFDSTKITILTPRLEEAAPGTPPLQAGDTRPVNVSVTINFNEPGEVPRTDSLPQGFTYTNRGGLLQPVILSLTPSSGPNEGGTTVVVSGDGFESPIKVEFGFAASNEWLEAQILSISRTRLEVRTPAASGFGQFMLNQIVDMRVTNLTSGLFATFNRGFKYGVRVLITSMGPTQGLYLGGTLVTIFGQGFDSPVAVAFTGCGGGASGSLAQQPISVSGTEIVIRTVGVAVSSCADVACTGVGVTNIETGDSGTAGIGFRYVVPRPTVTSVSPASGPQAGGTPIAVFGSNYVAGITSVALKRTGTYTASVTGVSGCDASGLCSTVSAVTPSVPTTEFTATEVACDDNGDGTQGRRYQPTPFTVSVNVGPCSADLNNGFTYLPSDTSCRNDVAGAPVANFTFFQVTNPAGTIQYTDTSTNGPTSWSWDFTNDGTVDSTARNPQNTFGGPGTYATRLRACNAIGCGEVVKSVTVTP